jgi:6-phospho-beta-glucosidase
MRGRSKVAVLGGGGLRTPLLIYGLAHARAAIAVRELALYDVDARRAALMAGLGAEIVGSSGIRITTTQSLAEAVRDASFVLSSIRVGGMAARARDERIAIEHGFAGQETTGPGGLAMALRTIPIALAHAQCIERHAPDAWLINFTNPAGLISQALMSHTNLRVIGICDTPSELFHRIAWSLGEPYEQLEFQYFGLNHLGWVRAVKRNSEDLMPRLLADDAALGKLYPADLFDHALIRTIGMIPTEYVFFYYSQKKAHGNQQAAGASRGEEILRLNTGLVTGLAADLAAGKPYEALERYKGYLNQRNASYMRLEGAAESALAQGAHHWNPFEGETGYHRIAIDLMKALSSDEPKSIVVNVRNDRTMEDLAPEDVIEAPSLVDRSGAKPVPAGRLPDAARGLVTAVKQYERLAIRAAVEKSFDLARLALLENPIVGDWERSGEVLEALVASDEPHLGYLRR